MRVVKKPTSSLHWRALPTFAVVIRNNNNFPRRMIKIPSHPHAVNGWVINARWVMEKHLRRFLLPKNIVWHINKNTLDDRIKNLRVFRDRDDFFAAMDYCQFNYCMTDYYCDLKMVYEIFGIDKYVYIPGKLEDKKKRRYHKRARNI